MMPGARHHVKPDVMPVREVLLSKLVGRLQIRGELFSRGQALPRRYSFQRETPRPSGAIGEVRCGCRVLD
jgi:hypothetical protein